MSCFSGGWPTPPNPQHQHSVSPSSLMYSVGAVPACILGMPTWLCMPAWPPGWQHNWLLQRLLIYVQGTWGPACQLLPEIRACVWAAWFAAPAVSLAQLSMTRCMDHGEGHCCTAQQILMHPAVSTCVLLCVDLGHFTAADSVCSCRLLLRVAHTQPTHCQALPVQPAEALVLYTDLLLKVVHVAASVLAGSMVWRWQS